MRYVDFYFYVCLDELFADKDSYWESDLNGNEIQEIAEYLQITLDRNYIINTYWNESLNNIDIFHSKNDYGTFLYFDLRRMRTDQNDMFFLGVRCSETSKKDILNKLVSIYDLLKTTGSFNYDKWGRKLLDLYNDYLLLIGDEYADDYEIIHHK